MGFYNLYDNFEHLTKDSQGYVYWKDTRIEHYSYRDEDEERQECLMVIERCKHLESIGVPVNGVSAVWHWSWYEDMQTNNPLKSLIASPWGMYESDDAIMFVLSHENGQRINTWEDDRKVFVKWDGQTLTHVIADVDLESIDTTYHVMKRLDFNIPNAGQGDNLGYCYATLQGLSNFLTSHNIHDSSILEHLNKGLAENYNG